MKTVLISMGMIAYCAREFAVELLEHVHPLILLGHIPVGMVHEGGVGHDLLLLITESDGKVGLLPVETIKIAHTRKISENEMRMSFSQTRLATGAPQPLRKVW